VFQAVDTRVMVSLLIELSFLGPVHGQEHIDKMWPNTWQRAAVDTRVIVDDRVMVSLFIELSFLGPAHGKEHVDKMAQYMAKSMHGKEHVDKMLKMEY
jgi:hypothetical protein